MFFRNGDITEEEFRRQTIFARKGRNISVSKQFECFLRDLRECPNKKFLLIPKHAGGVTLPDCVTTYISAESVTDDGRTLLIEVNDGYALGCYGLFYIDYAKLLSARWAELTGTEDECAFDIK